MAGGRKGEPVHGVVRTDAQIVRAASCPDVLGFGLGICSKSLHPNDKLLVSLNFNELPLLNAPITAPHYFQYFSDFVF